MSLTLSAILLTVAFVLPGYLANCARRRFVIRRWPSGANLVFESLAASTFIYIGVVLVLWGTERMEYVGNIIAEAATHSDWTSPPYGKFEALVRSYLLVLIAAPLAGAAWGIVQGNELCAKMVLWVRGWTFVDRLYCGLRLHPLNQWNSEWDRLFHMSPTWVYVILKDGTRYLGLFSGATAYPDPHELLLEETVVWLKEDDISKPGESIGPDYSHVWIRGDEIKAIYALVSAPTPSSASAAVEPASGALAPVPPAPAPQ